MEKLDHPILFLLVLAIAMLSIIKILHWGSMKAANSITNETGKDVAKSLAAFTSLPG